MSHLRVQCQLDGKEIPNSSLTYQSRVDGGCEAILIRGKRLEIGIFKTAPSLGDFIDAFSKATPEVRTKILEILTNHQGVGAEFVAIMVSELATFPKDVVDD